MIPLRIDAAAVEPVSVADLRGYLRVDSDDGGTEDGLLQALITAVRASLEIETRRILVPGRYRIALPGWPPGGRLPLPLSPLVALVRAGFAAADGFAYDNERPRHRARARSPRPRKRGREAATTTGSRSTTSASALPVRPFDQATAATRTVPLKAGMSNATVAVPSAATGTMPEERARGAWVGFSADSSAPPSPPERSRPPGTPSPSISAP